MDNNCTIITVILKATRRSDESSFTLLKYMFYELQMILSFSIEFEGMSEKYLQKCLYEFCDNYLVTCSVQNYYRFSTFTVICSLIFGDCYGTWWSVFLLELNKQKKKQTVEFLIFRERKAGGWSTVQSGTKMKGLWNQDPARRISFHSGVAEDCKQGSTFHL